MSNSRWRDDEVELFRQLREDGMSMRQISARLGRSEYSLTRKVERLDLPRRSGHFPPASRPKHVKRAGKNTLPALRSTQ